MPPTSCRRKAPHCCGDEAHASQESCEGRLDCPLSDGASVKTPAAFDRSPGLRETSRDAFTYAGVQHETQRAGLPQLVASL